MVTRQFNEVFAMSSTTDATGDVPGERVRLNLRVSKSVKDAYESCITEKHGQKHPYAGTELERELRLRLDEGTIGELYSSIPRLADAFGKAPREKKNLSTPDDGTTVVGYRVSKSIRNAILSLTSKLNHTNPGAFVETVMNSYAVGESADERLINLVDRIKNATEHEFNDELSAKERRTKAIADELGDSFTVDDFGQAIESGTKISNSNYTRNTYLSRVLDEKDCTWHPRKRGLFVPADDVPPEDRRDPRNKPYTLMSDGDKKTAIKYDVYQTEQVYKVSDALSMLNNKPQPNTVKGLMREIGETDAFGYRKGADRKKNDADDVLRLKVPPEDVLSSSDHKDLSQIVEHQAETTETTEQTETDGTQWVQEAADRLPDVPIENLPDAVVRNKIAEATNTNIQREDNGGIPDRLLESITEEQVGRVREYAADGTEKPASTPAGGGGNTGETTRQQPDIDPKSRLDALSSAEPARTDGGETKR
jgi:hypothetical protein